MKLCTLQRPLKLTSNTERKRHRVYCEINKKDILASESRSESKSEPDLSNKKIIIIGGTGRVGQSTASSLLNNIQDINITLGSRSIENFKSLISKNKQFQNKTKFAKVDINDINSIKVVN